MAILQLYFRTKASTTSQGSYDHGSFIGEKTETLKSQMTFWISPVVRKKQNCNLGFLTPSPLLREAVHH